MTLQIVGETPKDVLSIVDLVLGAITNEHTRRGYETDLNRFMVWWREVGSPKLNKAVINEFKQALLREDVGASAINRNLSAVKKLVSEAEDNGLINPILARGIQRVEGVPVRGESVRNWLTKEDAQELLGLPDPETVKGVRDRAILAVLLGCGLRREELVDLKWEDIQQREGRWVVVVRHGKRNKRRIVPMAPWTKVAVDKWDEIAPRIGVDFSKEAGGGSAGMYIFLPLNKSGQVTGVQLSTDAVYALVKQYAEELGLENISPHDLRRTFAKLARKGGAHLEQIQMSLGHESIETTMRYIGEEQDFNLAPCDVLGLEV